MSTQESETLTFDVVIVGAGPAGLATGIRLAQLAKEKNLSLSICILEKGSEIGAHILSGAVFEPRALNELIPDWKQQGAPLDVPVSQDRMFWLTQKRAWRLPLPAAMQNHGNYIIRLGKLCRWLGERATALGVEIFPGFAATEMVFDPNNPKKVIGVRTGDMGVDKQGHPKAHFQPGITLLARYTVLAEGCRGSLSQPLIARFGLDQNASPQTYGLGIKEVWEVDSPHYHAGHVSHTVGWPLERETYGGSFIYHLPDNQVAVGFVVGLDYANPYLSPFEEFQQFKHHPHIKPLFQGGRRIGYGARSLNEGGIQSLPSLHFPGGLLIGCAAGFLNVPKIKGSHTAMKSGMLAAEAIIDAWAEPVEAPQTANLARYATQVKQSWVWQELHCARNVRPAFRWGLVPGLLYAAIDNWVFRGRAPWTFRIKTPDYACLKQAKQVTPKMYPAPDNQISFDRLSSLPLAHLSHEEDQIVHLKIRNADIPIAVNWQLYQSPEQRYCPAAVYEIVQLNQQTPYLQINAQNCVHCKACDIKDPTQNIQWTPPEGGSGPNYPNL